MGVGGCGGQTPSTLTSLARGPQEGGFRSAGGSRPVPGLDPPKDDDMTIRGFLRGGGLCAMGVAPPPQAEHKKSPFWLTIHLFSRKCVYKYKASSSYYAPCWEFFLLTLLPCFVFFCFFLRFLASCVSLLSSCRTAPSSFLTPSFVHSSSSPAAR